MPEQRRSSSSSSTTAPSRPPLPPTTERHSAVWMDRGKNACKYMRTNYSKLINFCAKRREVARRASKQAGELHHHYHHDAAIMVKEERTDGLGSSRDHCRKKCSLCNRKFIPFLSRSASSSTSALFPSPYLDDGVRLYFCCRPPLLLSIHDSKQRAATTKADSSSGRGTAIFSTRNHIDSIQPNQPASPTTLSYIPESY